MADESSLRQRYRDAHQDHVFAQYEELSTQDRTALLEQLANIQVEKIAGLLESARAGDGNKDDIIEPFPDSNAGSQSESPDLALKFSEIGLRSIARGQVAALVLAGGQGTRLGFDGPKGMYDIGLPSHKTLFQLMSERIQRLKDLAAATAGKDKCALPFYVMTSPVNHAATKAFFDEQKYFGLGPENVVLFQQGMLPCLTPEGKIIMETAGKVAMAPDGNGGIYPSLLASGALENMTSRGLKYVHVFSIDNALVKPADPIFCGFCIDKGADCGNKSTRKSHPHEKVGVVALRAGKPCVVEYSEITSEMAERVDEGGRLAFGAGNICNHFYTVDFLQNRVLPNMGNLYHVANKKIPYYDAEKKATVKPESNNGIKLETFIFDVFPLSEKFAVWEVEREEEFAPVKNAPGSPSDSPDTARAMISALAKKWLTAGGATLSAEPSDGPSLCEISPLISYAGEGLQKYEGQSIQIPFRLS